MAFAYTVHYLIDGHNLIAHMPDISLDDPNDEAKLVLRLRSWTASGRKRRVTVIFDGGLPGGEARHLSSGPVKVLFATAGRPADALLKSRVGKVSNPPEYTLVSSDREVRAAATARRMPLLSAEQFARRLRTPEREDDGMARPGANRLSDEEVAEWLHIFGHLDEGRSD